MPRCLLLGARWQHEHCNAWRHFVCEIHMEGHCPKWPQLTSSEFVSNKTCLSWKERQSSENGSSISDYHLERDESCFHFVFLQYTRTQAETFCEEELRGSLASVNTTMRGKGDGETQGFDDLLQQQRGRRIDWHVNMVS